MASLWRVIPEFPTYLAHPTGRVRHMNSRVDRKPADNGGALTISLHSPETGRMTTRNLGALILSAFVGSRPYGATCSHVNGNYRDNRVRNLAWETQADNCGRKRQHGTHGLKLTEEEVAAIRERLASGETTRGIAKEFGVWQSTVSRIGTGRAWHVADG